MIDLDAIKMEALSLDIGETTQVECPQCGRPKLSITRKEDAIAYNCWRPACTMRGYIGSVPGDKISAHISAFKPNIYMGITATLTHEFHKMWLRPYGIPMECVNQQGIQKVIDSFSPTIAMPLYTHLAERWGTTTKSWNCSQKTMHYVAKDYPMLHFPICEKLEFPSDGTIVLVEDVLSAMKIQWYTHHRAAALLGTSLDNEKVRVLLAAGFKDVILWLDRDAITKATELKQKYALFFNSFKIITTLNDPKDTPSEEIISTIKF